jgi:hypothetical protein
MIACLLINKPSQRLRGISRTRFDEALGLEAALGLDFTARSRDQHSITENIVARRGSETITRLISPRAIKIPYSLRKQFHSIPTSERSNPNRLLTSHQDFLRTSITMKFVAALILLFSSAAALNSSFGTTSKKAAAKKAIRIPVSSQNR